MALDWDSPESGCWYPIPGHPNYAVSESGQVLSVRSGRVLQPWPNSAGYPVVRLYPSKRNRLVHRLVALTFYGPCPEGSEVRHLDGDRTNPRAANLQYGTRSENNYDKRQHGTDHMLNRDRCKSGHELAGDNLRIDPKGNRKCRECRRATRRRYYERTGR